MTGSQNEDDGIPEEFWVVGGDTLDRTFFIWSEEDKAKTHAKLHGGFSATHVLRADLAHLRTESILLSKIEELVSDLHDQASAQVNLYDQGWMDFATTLVEEIEKLRQPTQETGECPADSPAVGSEVGS